MKISIGNWNILNILIHTLSCTAWIRLHAIKEKNSGSIKFGRRCSIQTLLAIPSVVMKPMRVHWSCQTNESYICHSFFAQSCSLLWCTKEYGFELGLLLHACHSVFTIYFQAMFGEARALWFFWFNACERNLSSCWHYVLRPVMQRICFTCPSIHCHSGLWMGSV